MEIQLVKLCGYCASFLDINYSLKQIQLKLKDVYPMFDFEIHDNHLIGVHGIFNKLNKSGFLLCINKNEILLQRKVNNKFSNVLNILNGVPRIR